MSSITDEDKVCDATDLGCSHLATDQTAKLPGTMEKQRSKGGSYKRSMFSADNKKAISVLFGSAGVARMEKAESDFAHERKLAEQLAAQEREAANQRKALAVQRAAMERESAEKRRAAQREAFIRRTQAERKAKLEAELMVEETQDPPPFSEASLKHHCQNLGFSINCGVGCVFLTTPISRWRIEHDTRHVLRVLHENSSLMYDSNRWQPNSNGGGFHEQKFMARNVFIVVSQIYRHEQNKLRNFKAGAKPQYHKNKDANLPIQAEPIGREQAAGMDWKRKLKRERNVEVSWSKWS